jgi:predicted house-cleaning NTP pyrophosphatase (Maf/HAM1 superfamily)
MNVPPIILASNSPRRREILTWTGLEFSIYPADVDEARLENEPAQEYALRVAHKKAKASASFAPFNGLVVAADTIVADGEYLLGKPIDHQAAKEMLLRLRGKIHQVYSAVVVSVPSKGVLQQCSVQQMCTCESSQTKNWRIT